MNISIHKMANGYVYYPTPRSRECTDDSESYVFETVAGLTEFLISILEQKEKKNG